MWFSFKKKMKEMEAIKTLDRKVSGFKTHTDPAVVKWFSELK